MKAHIIVVRADRELGLSTLYKDFNNLPKGEHCLQSEKVSYNNLQVKGRI
jgi:hypothetical protein